MDTVSKVTKPAGAKSGAIVPSSLTEEWGLRIAALVDEGVDNGSAEYNMDVTALTVTDSVLKDKFNDRLYVRLKAVHKTPQCLQAVEILAEHFTGPHIPEHAILIEQAGKPYFLCPICGAKVSVKELLKAYHKESKAIPIIVDVPEN